MPKCYYMGGLGETELYTTDFLSAQVWINLFILMVGQVGKMRLAPNGSDPGLPDGVALVPTNPVPPYLGLPALQLQAQLLTSGYDVRPWVWDWRKTIYPAGVALAADIRYRVPSSDPCTLIGHSAGGLVCRAAWTELGMTGDQGRVRRIITLGTPHWGSYTICNFWCGSSQTIDLLKTANQVWGYNTYGFAPEVFGYQYLENLDYQQLALTWPAFFDTLPVLGAPDAGADPNRVLLYDASNWPPSVRPSQDWLDWAKNHTAPWLLNPASQPPAHILTCVSGYGTSVDAALVNPSQLGSPTAFGGSIDGDGAVTRASAELGTGKIWRYGISHENLFPSLAANGDLAEMVLEVRTPGPPPPAEQSNHPQTTFLAPLPLPLSPQVGAPNAACSGSKCMC